MREEIRECAEKAIAKKVFPGCVVGIIRANGSREVWPFGNLTYDTGAPLVREDTIYDLASITKSIPTASIALLLIAEGKLRLTDKLIEHIPEFKSRWREEVTIEHLLRYAIHGLQLSTLKDKTPDEILASAYSHELADTPGTQFLYTNLPALLLGIVVERVCGSTLDRCAQEYFFDPLHMSSTTFFPNVRVRNSNIAPTEIDGGGEVCGIVHDECARVFARARKAVGHAGLFSTAPDILNFLESLLRGNEGFTKSIITGAEKGLGWQVNQPWFMGAKCGPRTFGKTGFTGTSVVCDVERGTAFVILSNRTYPKRPADGKEIDAFRRNIADVVLK